MLSDDWIRNLSLGIEFNSNILVRNYKNYVTSEPFLTMLYNINSSPLLVTKQVFILKIILSNYQESSGFKRRFERLKEPKVYFAFRGLSKLRELPVDIRCIPEDFHFCNIPSRCSELPTLVVNLPLVLWIAGRTFLKQLFAELEYIKHGRNKLPLYSFKSKLNFSISESRLK